MKGKRVIIRAQGCVIHGTILSANNWGTREKPNWYIEYTIDESRSSRPRQYSGNYGYWKQGVDGGTVEFVDETDRLKVGTRLRHEVSMLYRDENNNGKHHYIVSVVEITSVTPDKAGAYAEYKTIKILEEKDRPSWAGDPCLEGGGFRVEMFTHCTGLSILEEGQA